MYKAEAVLENQGESKRIGKELYKDPKVIEWRYEIQKICRSIVDEKGIDNISPDIERENFLQSVADDIKSKLAAFLQNQFEDHI